MNRSYTPRWAVLGVDQVETPAVLLARLYSTIAISRSCRRMTIGSSWTASSRDAKSLVASAADIWRIVDNLIGLPDKIKGLGAPARRMSCTHWVNSASSAVNHFLHEREPGRPCGTGSAKFCPVEGGAAWMRGSSPRMTRMNGSIRRQTSLEFLGKFLMCSK